MSSSVLGTAVQSIAVHRATHVQHVERRYMYKMCCSIPSHSDIICYARGIVSPVLNRNLVLETGTTPPGRGVPNARNKDPRRACTDIEHDDGT